MRDEEVADTRMDVTKSKLLIGGMFSQKQSTVRLILVVLLRDKCGARFFWLGWYWLWTDQFGCDCGNFLFAMKVMTSSMRSETHNVEAPQLVELCIV